MSSQNLFQSIQAQVGNPFEKLILIILSDISNEKNECWPSYQYLAGLAECSRSTVIRGVKSLQEKGHLSIEVRPQAKSKNDSNLYTLHLSPKATGRVSEGHPGRVAEGNPVGVPQTPDTPIDTKHIFIGGWEAWVDYRKEIKKTMKPTTEKLQLKFLSNFDKPTQAKIINRSMTNGWSGLFPLPDDKTGHPGRMPPRQNDPASTRGRTLQQDLEDTSWA